MTMSLRLGMTLTLLLVLSVTSRAVPCSSVTSKPDAWVNGRIDALIVAARRAFDDERAEPAYERVLARIAARMRECSVKGDVVFVGRYGRFIQYIEMLNLASQPDHELGFKVADRQYFSETSQYVQVPDFLLDQGFMRAVSRFETLPKAKAYLKELNLTRAPDAQLLFFSYESQHLGTPDNDDSFRRFLILVPADVAGNQPEKWVQFGVTDPGARVRVRNVSVVSQVPGTDGTSQVYFKDFFRTYRRDGSITLRGRWELGYGDDKCVQCHKSGILPIFPEKGSVSGSETAALAAVNDRFQTYGAPRFGKYLDGNNYGPGLSTARVEDRVRRFGAGFDRTVVGKAMNCSACHNDDRMGAFNWPMDQVLISSFIKGGKMPYGSNLGPREREEIYDKLIEEYFSVSATNPGILKSWLLGSDLQASGSGQ